jgi:hypothetical protein
VYEFRDPSSAFCGCGSWGWGRIRTWTVPIFILSASNSAVLGAEDCYPSVGLLHPLPPSTAPWMGPSWDHPFVRESHVQDNVTQMQHDQEDIPVEAVHEEPPIVALNLSPTAQDFAASGGVLPVDAEAIVPVSVHPSPSKVQVNHEVASLTFFCLCLISAPLYSLCFHFKFGPGLGPSSTSVS